MTTFQDAASKADARLGSLYRVTNVFKGNLWFGANALDAYLT